MLEAVMLCVDNSDWSRNKDYFPSRLQAQQEASLTVATTKLQANAENSIGLLTLGGDVKVRAAPSGDMRSFHQAVQSLAEPDDGSAHLMKGIQTAQLALKHRLNRNQRQRIIIFVCSPLDVTESDVEKVGRTLKKNNVALDIVSFGEVERNSAVLKKLYQTVNSNNTSNLLEVQLPCPSLTRAITTSSILGAGNAGINPDDPFALDVDPTADPELLLALRLSLEEERERQARESAHMRTGDADEPGDATRSSNVVAGDSCVHVVQDDRPPTVEEIMGMQDLDEDLRTALLLSLQTAESAPRTEGQAQEDTPSQEPVTQAKNLSFASVSPPVPAANPMLSAAEMKRLAEMLPGVDVNDPEVMRALEELAKAEKKKD
ncbi:putative proteasome 26S subunit, non-ATPase, protein 4 [Gregarina niphandrodes]|uniref:Proteasome 26S subunit, non-ATPase, protein 4 n=1 Tax=Gregarina niphandrodes TaxID=110365 RepID=A0A023B058_GRENI|nr:putative proteasome 26S subunit, non-ATPase, protein 4 [Gregarina niphandrodes]EZG44965.1 putative proteasome 26S subunit, non-ATPase, protein 4 [Gregarina niphandrodes]|eukprot:XP_011132613.1 putative proteasome 26S subunit, non-ATPase, protein 4 [Gregarina niphandrodes]